MKIPEYTEDKIKMFQVALSMAGVTANQMTAELLYALSKVVDSEGGEDFSLREAITLSEGIKAKYNAKVAGAQPLPMRHDDGK